MPPRRPLPVHFLRTALLLAGILSIAVNLRAPITGLAPVLAMIQGSFALSTAQAGLLTTLPLLAFALLSPVAPVLARRVGLERALFAALVLIAGGVALRSAGPVGCLYGGTVVIGAGIAIGNVLLPSLLTRDFPQRIAAVTSAYTLTMGLAAAAASATVIPLATHPGLGWEGALAAVIVFPLAALVIWWPQLRPQPGRYSTNSAAWSASARGQPIWRSALAWQVTLFMGLNSFIYYVMIGWLPSILTGSGRSAAEAGSLHGVMQLASACAGLLLAPVIHRLQDQRAAAFGVSLLLSLGLLGLLALPGWAALWVTCFGFGSGACLILSLSFMGLRTHGSAQAAALSGMAQSIGYLLAACGPPLVGLLHDQSRGWSLPLALCLLLTLVIAWLGALAGRNVRVPGEEVPG
ncbi:MFS transporter [Zoogloea sp.]|uniref:MFS transporter n=1 Tax=Zoogloea sp. TaxID=49181 RepID=UPI00262DC3A5|nr:MFS transporter [Zoogloea sp.]MDD3354410.1 MFS transporter [Zoogloea sp.]